jgi:hypothetical protein
MRRFALAVSVILSACIFTVHEQPAAVVYAKPPPDRAEEAQPREGFVWTHGYWENVGGEWRWRDGRYEPDRAGYLWRDGHWERHGRTYQWVEGGWEPPVRKP